MSIIAHCESDMLPSSTSYSYFSYLRSKETNRWQKIEGVDLAGVAISRGWEKKRYG